MTYPDDVLSKIKKFLVRQKNKTEATLASLKTQDPFSDPDRLNDNAASDTEAKEESSHERMEALEKELSTHLSEVDEALGRLTKGTYGKCLSCGVMIDTDRLAIKPAARYCVDCERKKEK